jgi:hypothetical protein
MYFSTMKIIFYFAFLILINLHSIAQKNKPTIIFLDSGHATSLRGLCPVTDQIVWVSGSNGQVGKTLNGGKTWDWVTIKGFEKKDFRDIEAFSGVEAVIMGIDSPAYMLKTNNGGKTWKVVYEDHRKGIFLDAMAFWNEQSGIVIGDPIDNKIVIRRSFDGGNSWREIPEANYPVADSAEAMFASSGSNIGLMGGSAACFVTGGSNARFFYKDLITNLPLIKGKESTGANSVSVLYKKRSVEKIMVVGGDFNKPLDRQLNCAFSTDLGKTWQVPVKNPFGYRSCVDFINKNVWITCGTNGVDYTVDGGLNWLNFSIIGFHACRKAKKGNIMFLAGGGGKIAMVKFP